MDEKRSDLPGAIAAFRAELAIDPNHFEANLFLGNLLREGARPTRRCRYLERAARLRPATSAAQFSLGAVYVALGRTEEALPLLERVAAAAPDHLQTHMQLAVAYHRLGRTADSARAREAVGAAPERGREPLLQRRQRRARRACSGRRPTPAHRRRRRSRSRDRGSPTARPSRRRGSRCRSGRR